jgi:carbonic anhydrase/acetyltransferase-like protein (isoleucine patch superfamily)
MSTSPPHQNDPTSPRMVLRGEAYVATTASVVGDVRLGADTNIWYGAVVRGDDAPLSVGDRTNLQDGVVMHADTDLRNDVAEDVTVGHGALLHGVRVERWVLVGMGAVLLGRSVIGEGSIVAAGCVVSEGMVIPPYSLVVGVPARIVKSIDPIKRRDEAIFVAAGYVAKARDHASGRWRTL